MAKPIERMPARYLTLALAACLLLLASTTASGQPGESTETDNPAATDQTPATTPDPDKSEAELQGEEEDPPADEEDNQSTLSKVWNYELGSPGGTPIRFNQIVIALLIVLIGMWLAKQLTNMVSARLVRVSKVSETVAYSLGKIIYYLGSAVVILIAMQVAGIPTTVFTVIGGALAIGVGFGAQNLFNNLISGIIILTEKPIRRSDIVEIDGMEGKVAEIGNRRTRIRRFDGIDVLVPNSTFLESNVVNWTLHDAMIRGSVGVGVAYGSPVDKVRGLMLEVAKQHDKVIDTPAPTVLFTEFGDNTLNFLIYFWTHVQTPMDRMRLESDLRFAIDKVFTEHDITIAFPQRDLHLDTLKPLEVRMVNEPPADN